MPRASKASRRSVTEKAETDGLNAYLSACRDVNPFLNNRVNEPSALDVDVPSIHGAAFDRLVLLARQANTGGMGVGAMLLGGAGVGKSHLLSRLYRWAVTPARDGDGVSNACYVYVHNLLADPDRLPRYLLKYVVSRLTEGGQRPFHETPLFRLVDRALRSASVASGVGTWPAKISLEAYRASLDDTPGTRVVHDLLYQFYRHARPDRADEPARRYLASAAVAWLSGDEVDPEAAKTLRLPMVADSPAMLADNMAVEHVLLTLAQLARVSGQPLVLCVDQFENVERDHVLPLCQFLHALLDHAKNLLVIVSGVKQTLLGFREEAVISEASWDRLAQFKVEVKRVRAEDARHILEARLERFHEPFMGVNLVRERVMEDTLFPLGRSWFEKKVGDGIDFRPRDILTWARDAWMDHQMSLAGGFPAWAGGVEVESVAKLSTPVKPLTNEEVEGLIDSAVEKKIEEQLSQHRLTPGSLPADAGNLAGLLESLLGQCRGEGLGYTFRGLTRLGKVKGRLPAFDLEVKERREPDGREITTGVTCITNAGISASSALKRLLEEPRVDHRLLVTDQERKPLTVGPAGLEYYKDLQKLGSDRFQHLKLTTEQYGMLDALDGVVRMARSGDLEIELPGSVIRAVGVEEVVASHHRRDRYRAHPLLHPLLTEDGPIDDVKPPPLPCPPDADLRQYILAQLAWQMGSTAKAIAASYAKGMAPPRLEVERAWECVKTVATSMHGEGLIHANPWDADLYLILQK